jgi:hypothetical protein
MAAISNRPFLSVSARLPCAALRPCGFYVCEQRVERNTAVIRGAELASKKACELNCRIAPSEQKKFLPSALLRSEGTG